MSGAYHVHGGSGRGGGGGGGPCGACKFLRRKCVRSCVFSPYFDSDQGTAQFAAVHKVFGASNAAKLLHRIPPNRRRDAVISLCYEANARLRDPVYGCVSHIVSLQQQMISLQAELAYIQAKLSTLHPLAPLPHAHESSPESVLTSTTSMHLDPLPSSDMAMSSCSPSDYFELIDFDLQLLAQEVVSRCLPGVRFRSTSSH